MPIILPSEEFEPPIVTLPAVTLIPHNTPFVVPAPLLVRNAKPAMVLLLIIELVPAAVKAQLMEIYLIDVAFPEVV